MWIGLISRCRIFAIVATLPHFRGYHLDRRNTPHPGEARRVRFIRSLRPALLLNLNSLNPAPVVYGLEVLTAVSLMLGIFVRLGGVIGALQILNLWLGLYSAPGEWPWT